VMAQISSKRCQSVEFRARRETSSPRTIPARPYAYFNDELLKTLTVGRRRAGLAEVTVYSDHLIILPAEGDGAFAERVLARGTLGVFEHLAEWIDGHIERRCA
jgi:hypothetical protein